MKLEICHVDTCLPDFWSGHHLPHIQIPVHRGMDVKTMKQYLIDELHNGPVMGVNELEEEWFRQARIAVGNCTEKTDDYQPFSDLVDESDDEDAASVYAYFVFREVE